MNSPFAAHERERLITAILPDVPFDGWTRHAVRNAARRADMPVGEAMALFPRGAPDLIAEFSHWADRQMLERLLPPYPPPLAGEGRVGAEPVSLSGRVALALRMRFEV